MFPLFIRVPWLHAAALTLWFVVFYVGEISDTVRRHETIHFWQWTELLLVGFGAIYVIDFIRAFVQLWKFWPAYHCIRLELECHANDEDLDYIAQRPWFAWRKYSVQEEVVIQRAIIKAEER